MGFTYDIKVQGSIDLLDRLVSQLSAAVPLAKELKNNLNLPKGSTQGSAARSSSKVKKVVSQQEKDELRIAQELKRISAQTLLLQNQKVQTARASLDLLKAQKNNQKTLSVSEKDEFLIQRKLKSIREQTVLAQSKEVAGARQQLGISAQRQNLGVQLAQETDQIAQATKNTLASHRALNREQIKSAQLNNKDLQAQKLAAAEKQALLNVERQLSFLNNDFLQYQKRILSEAKALNDTKRKTSALSNGTLQDSKRELAIQSKITAFAERRKIAEGLGKFAKDQGITSQADLQDLGINKRQAERLGLLKKQTAQEKALERIAKRRLLLDDRKLQTAKHELSLKRKQVAMENRLQDLNNEELLQNKANLLAHEKIHAAKLGSLTVTKQIALAQKAGARTVKDFHAFGLSDRDIARLNLADKNVNSLAKSLKNAGLQGNKIAFTFRRLIGILAAFTIARKVTAAFGQMIKQMITFRAAIEQAELGVAALFVSTGKIVTSQGRQLIGQEALNAAIKLGRRELRLMLVDSIKTNATFLQLASTFQIAVGPAIAGGLNVASGEVREFVRGVSQAASAAGVAQNQLAEEVRSLLSGTGSVKNTRLLQILFGAESGSANKQIKAAIKAGKLMDLMREKLSAFSDAGDLALNNFNVLFTNLVGGFQLVLASGGVEFFNELKATMADVLKFLTGINDEGLGLQLNPAVIAAFKSIGDALARVVVHAREVGVALGPSGIQSSAEGIGVIIEAIGKGIVDIIASFLFVSRVAATWAKLLGGAGVLGALTKALTLVVKLTAAKQVLLLTVGLVLSTIRRTNSTLKDMGVIIQSNTVLSKLFLAPWVSVKASIVKVTRLVKGFTIAVVSAVTGLSTLGSARAISTLIRGLARLSLQAIRVTGLIAALMLVLFLGTKKYIESITGIKLTWKQTFDFMKITLFNWFDRAISKLAIWGNKLKLVFKKIQVNLAVKLLRLPGDMSLAIKGAALQLEAFLLNTLTTMLKFFGEKLFIPLFNQLQSMALKISKIPGFKTIGEHLFYIASAAKSSFKTVENASDKAIKKQIANNKAAIKSRKEVTKQLLKSASKEAGIGKLKDKIAKQEAALKKKKIDDARIESSFLIQTQQGPPAKKAPVKSESINARVQSAISQVKDIQSAIGSIFSESTVDASLGKSILKLVTARKDLEFAKAKFVRPDVKELAAAQQTLDMLELESELNQKARQSALDKVDAIIKGNQKILVEEQKAQTAAENFVAEKRKAAVFEKNLVKRKEIFKEIKAGELSLQASQGAVAVLTEQINNDLVTQVALKTQINNLNEIDRLAEEQAKINLEQKQAQQGNGFAQVGQGIVDGIKKSAAEAPSLYQATLNTMQSATAGFSATVSGLFTDALSGKDVDAGAAFGQFFAQLGAMILQTIIQALIMNAILGALSPAVPALPKLSGGGGGFNPSSLFGSPVATANKGGLIPDVQGYDTGGRVGRRRAKPRISKKDTVPAMLTPGEFIIPAESTKLLSPAFLEGLRTLAFSPQSLPGLEVLGAGTSRSPMAFNDGGFVGSTTTAVRQAAESGSQSSNVSSESQPRLVIPATESTMEELLSGGKNAFQRALKDNKGLLKGLLA